MPLILVYANNSLQPTPGRCHVLVAEDNEVNQKVLSLLLKRLQATVEVCANGQEAIDALLTDPTKFDLILMDVQVSNSTIFLS